MKFPYGELYFDYMPPKIRKNVAIIHNNWIHGKNAKIKRFQENKLWKDQLKNESREILKDSNTEKVDWILPPQHFAKHDGSLILGNNYLSTTCFRGKRLLQIQ